MPAGSVEQHSNALYSSLVLGFFVVVVVVVVVAAAAAAADLPVFGLPWQMEHGDA